MPQMAVVCRDGRWLFKRQTICLYVAFYRIHVYIFARQSSVVIVRAQVRTSEHAFAAFIRFDFVRAIAIEPCPSRIRISGDVYFSIPLIGSVIRIIDKRRLCDRKE